jgi:hypothetical protein
MNLQPRAEGLQSEIACAASRLFELPSGGRAKDVLCSSRKHGGPGVTSRLEKQRQLHRAQHLHHSVSDVMRDHSFDVVLSQETGNASVVLG